MKFFLFLLLAILFGCNSSNNDKIILTSGIGMNPSTPRFGIEINNTKGFYCKEIIEKKGYYKYYSFRIKENESDKIKKDIKHFLSYKIKSSSAIDATPYQLITNIDKETDSVNFYLNSLNKHQMKIFYNILNFKKTRMLEIKHHDFPKYLLMEKLPEPPLPIEK